jgi:uncharacterized protein
MKRNIINELLKWKESRDRLPLLIRGARQVGKTYIVEEFGKTHYPDMVKINFEQQREFKNCFNILYPEKILQLVYAVGGKAVVPGKTLLFLDEIQECPAAISALRYFYEQMPELHVIAAGSLLEFTMRQPDFNMPVGRVQSCYLKPLSFIEFLIAAGKNSLVEYISNVNIHDGIDNAVHQQLLMHVREYLVLGGMPAVLNTFFNTADLEQSQIRQHVILENYRHDFAKYAKYSDIKYLQSLFDKAPGLIGKHFKYSAVDPHILSRDLKRCVRDLIDAGVIYTCFATAASGLPLTTTINEKKFKLFFVDVGLVNYTTHLSSRTLMDEDLILLHQGMLAEQFVGQELLAYMPCYRNDPLYYWESSKPTSLAEIDFVLTTNDMILPIEVKAGATGRLKSLKIFMDEKSSPIGLRISQNLLSFDNTILSIPLYMISQINRLVNEGPPMT